MSEAFATEKEVERCVSDLKRKWSNRWRLDREVLGAIELAFMRGYQAGFENARSKPKRGRSK